MMHPNSIIQNNGFLVLKCLILFLITIVASILLETDDFAFAESNLFEKVSIHLEQNFTDKDTEIVFIVKGTDEGLKTLIVFDPNGKQIFQLIAGRKTLGTREFTLESPEPGLHEVLLAYPKGEYTFKGETFSGLKLTGRSTLIHDIPAPPRIIFPEGMGTKIDSDIDLTVKWNPVAGATKYLIEIERKDPTLEIKLQGEEEEHASSFTVSANWLKPEGAYQIGVAAVNAAGNITWVEQIILTAP